MQAAPSKPDTKHQVGKFTFTVVADQSTPEAQERWDRRSEVIANWLMAQWEREQRQNLAERN